MLHFYENRPQILLLTKLNHKDEVKYFKLLQLASQLKAGKGLTMVASLVQADYSKEEDRKRLEIIKQVLICKLRTIQSVISKFCTHRILNAR